MYQDKMYQEELFRNLVSVPVWMNNEETMIELDGPFHDFVELFIEVERSEMLKNKENPDRIDQIDLVKLGNELRIPGLFTRFGSKVKRIKIVNMEGNESFINTVLVPSVDDFVEIPLHHLWPAEIYADIAEMEEALNSMYTLFRRGRIDLKELALELALVS